MAAQIQRTKDTRTTSERPHSWYSALLFPFHFFFCFRYPYSVTATSALNVHAYPSLRPGHYSRITTDPCYADPACPATHVSSPSSPHNSSSVSPSMSSTSRIASLRSKTQATLRPILPFDASETSPLMQDASTYDRLIGMRTVAIYKHVSVSANRKDYRHLWYITAPGQLSVFPGHVQSAVPAKDRLRDQEAAVHGNADPKIQLLQLW